MLFLDKHLTVYILYTHITRQVLSSNKSMQHVLTESVQLKVPAWVIVFGARS